MAGAAGAEGEPPTEPTDACVGAAADGGADPDGTEEVAEDEGLLKLGAKGGS